MLSPLTQIICLADLDQQIFDHLPGIGPGARGDNQQFAETARDQLGCGQSPQPRDWKLQRLDADILSNTYRNKPYLGVSKLSYNPNPKLLITLPRSEELLECCKVQSKKPLAIGEKASRSFVFLVIPLLRLPRRLNTGRSQYHTSFYSTRLRRFLPLVSLPTCSNRWKTMQVNEILAQALELLADMRKAAGAKDALKLQDWAEKARKGAIAKAAFVQGPQCPHRTNQTKNHSRVIPPKIGSRLRNYFVPATAGSWLISPRILTIWLRLTAENASAPISRRCGNAMSIYASPRSSRYSARSRSAIRWA